MITKEKKSEHYFLDERQNRSNKRLNSKNVKLIKDSLSKTLSITSGKDEFSYIDTAGRTIERYLSSHAIGINN